MAQLDRQTIDGSIEQRQLLPGEPPDSLSADVARRWLTIYEQREALLRHRLPGATSEALVAGVDAGRAFWSKRAAELAGLSLDESGRLLLTDSGSERWLTRREAELVRFLGAHPNRFFPDHVLAVRAWGPECGPDQVRIYIRRLRAKLEGSGWELIAVRGRGYSLQKVWRAEPARRPGPPTWERVQAALDKHRALVDAHRHNLERAAQLVARAK